MKKYLTLSFLRTASLIVLLAGAAGSIGLMLYAGRHNSSVLLLAVFAVWVLSPFAGFFVADKISKRWTVHTRASLYFLMVVLTIVSLFAYIGVFSPPGTKPAFMFLVVPFISWILIVTVIPIAKRLSRNSTDNT